jgi:ribosomal-protein-serine acetyltransferase
MPLITPAPHLHIRSFTLDDLDPLAEVVKANRAHLSPWLPWAESIRSGTDERFYIEMGIDKEARNEGFEAGIFVHNVLVGSVGLHYIAPDTRATEIGYWLAAGSTGNGVMTTSVRAVVAYAFEVLQLNRIEVRAAADNLKSRAVPERLGFRLEGVLRQAHTLHGALHDLAIYGLLASEWPTPAA